MLSNAKTSILPKRSMHLAVLLPLLTFISGLASNPIQAQEKTSTGFVFPIGKSQWDHGAGWYLDRDPAHGGKYFDGYYHIGEDMLAPQGASVYAISEGDVVKVYTTPKNDPWFIGIGNSVIFVKHRRQDGQYFLAEYMHIRPTINEGDHVTAGQVIARVGPWYNATHLHFGIHPDTSVPSSRWGMMPNSAWAGTNGFVDPVDYILHQSPYGNISAKLFISETDTTSFFKFGPSNWWHYVSGIGDGGNLMWTWNNQNHVDNYAEWHPTIASGGTYEVYVYVPRKYATTKSARYEVHHADGRTDVVVSQWAIFDAWTSLGKFRFDQGTTGYLRLTDQTGEAEISTQVCFDSALWVRR